MNESDSLLIQLIMEGNQDEWIVVTKRKRKFIQKEYHPSKISNKGKQLYTHEEDSSTLQNFITNSSTKTNRELVQSIIKNRKYADIKIVCLGLGSFQTEFKPQLQFLFLKHCIIEAVGAQNCKGNVNVYDPVFSPSQIQELTALKTSQHQSIVIQPKTSHLFFMPHCDRNLYEKVCELRVLQSECEVFVIGNSIEEYKQKAKLLKDTTIAQFQRFSTKEIKLSDYREAFNDTYLYQLEYP